MSLDTQNATNVWAPLGSGTTGTGSNQWAISGANSSSDTGGDQILNVCVCACVYEREIEKRETKETEAPDEVSVRGQVI